MTTVLLVIHLMVVIALVGVVLLQRSEGGALGIGGGGGFMTSRGTANVLTRTTAILAAVFFLTSLALSVLPRFIGGQGSILDTVPGAATSGPSEPVGGNTGGVLDDLNRLTPGAEAPAAPGAESPAAPAEGGAAAPAAPATETPAATAPAPATTTAPAEPAPAAPAPAPATPAPAAPAQ